MLRSILTAQAYMEDCSVDQKPAPQASSDVHAARLREASAANPRLDVKLLLMMWSYVGRIKRTGRGMYQKI